MNAHPALRFWWLPVLLALASAHVAGATVAELEASGRLEIQARVAPGENTVPGQRVTLTLEIATDTWFTGGTRIGIPEIPGLVILQTEQFASNASETRDGQTWVIQRWTLDIFPQRAGDFTIGALPVQLQVSDGGGGDATGEVRSPPVRFSVAVPDSLATAGQWVAAPRFTASQSFDRSLDGLAVGDAFEQEVRFEAEDVLAMMLPTFEAGRHPGLAAYPAPPVLDNSTNRGQSLATRTTRISYIVEQPGTYRLGARDYLWWNTREGALEVVSLPETRIEVAGSASPAGGPDSLPDKRHLLLLLAGLAAAGLLGWLAVRLSPRLQGDRVAALLCELSRRWQALRRPALPSRLNPDSSAGE